MATPSKSRKSNLIAAGTQRIKAIVRKLPPNLPEELFWRSCEQWVNDNTVKERWFMKGALKGPRFSSSSILSRAYIAFKSPEELATFSQGYDGHIFRDKQGNEFSAIVEFAPSQKLPLNPKVDARQGTIEDDEDYKSFLALLEKGENPSKEKATSQIIADPSKPESTPLLEALITSKKNLLASTSKFSKHKPQHASTSKPRTKEDDAHFSRAQPIVPSGPVTLLTAAKPDGISKAGGGSTNPPTLSPSISAKLTIQAKESGSKGKGKGKGGGEQQEPSSKPGKGKNPPKKQAAPTESTNPSSATGEAGSSKPGLKDEPSKKPATPKKKKPPPAPVGDSTQGNTKESVGEGADKNGASGAGTSNARERGRGRGRGGAGRGGVVVVPKILTKIISEGAGSSTPSKSGGATSAGAIPPPETVNMGPSESSSAPGGESGLPKSATVTGATGTSAPDSDPGGEAAEHSNGPLEQSGRGGERGRRPFIRGRGRGRGRGAVRGGAASPAS